MREFDRLGRPEFLRKYGFGPAVRYFVVHEGREYDSKALAGVAYGYQHRDEGPLRGGTVDFYGGQRTVVKQLRQLGFEVRDAADQEAPARSVSAETSPPRFWLKLVYNDEREDPVEYWRRASWVSDAHETLPNGRPKLRLDGQPTRQPSYAVGDELVVYDLEFERCPARLRVRTPPKFDPDRVGREGSPGDAARWGWLTEVELIAVLPAEDAPALGDLRVHPRSIRQRDHISLRQDQYAEAVRRISSGEDGGGLPDRPAARRRRSERVPIEAMNVEEVVLRDPPESRSKVMRRSEQRLVRSYAEFLEAAGRKISRRKIYDSDGEGPLYCDLYDESRGNLVEAKAAATRAAVRMAIGQLKDYRRFIRSCNRLALLTEERPRRDLERLLRREQISVVWRSGDHFEDNAGGRFT